MQMQAKVPAPNPKGSPGIELLPWPGISTNLMFVCGGAVNAVTLEGCGLFPFALGNKFPNQKISLRINELEKFCFPVIA